MKLVRAASLIGFAELVRAEGGDPATILERSGLCLEDLVNPEHYLPSQAVVSVIEEAASVLGVADFGLRLCALQGVETLGLLGLVIQSASTVRDGMMQGGKYIHFHNPTLGYRTFLTPDGQHECVEVFHRYASSPAMPQVTELCVAYMCRLLEVLSGGRLRPVSIHFRHLPVASSSQYRRHLDMLPSFGASFDGISINPLAWRQPLPSHNPLLQRFVERFLLGTPASGGAAVSDQVRTLLGNLVRVGMADLGSIAGILRIHPRTLQRRLRVEGHAFEELRDGERKAWASQLLEQQSLSLGQVAQLLGFSDQAVLTRACQRWFGKSPRKLRKERESGSQQDD